MSKIIKRKSYGFTIIELVVVFGIIITMSTILISYSRRSGRQLLLSSTESKVVGLISRAKFLSIQTFFEDTSLGAGLTKICAYGVHVDSTANEIFIFQDRVNSSVDCPGDNKYSPSGLIDARLTGELNEVKLDSQIMYMSGTTNLDDVVFIPPDPTIKINNGTIASAELGVGLYNEPRGFKIVVDTAGQSDAVAQATTPPSPPPPPPPPPPTGDGSGTVICTELFRQGYMSEDIYIADKAHGEKIARTDPYLMSGYHLWAKPVVRLMKKSPTVTKIVAVIAINWAEQMAYEEGVIDKGSRVGKTMMIIGEPITRFIGVTAHNVDSLHSKNIAGLSQN